MGTYKSRIADDLLKIKLRGKGAVLIEGPKWSGKTTTAEHAAGSVIYIDDPRTVNDNILMSEIGPSRLLEGETPRLIDEWQIVPKLWDAIRFEIDHRDGLGLFILTGSSVPAATDDIHHTGTGRFSWLMMRPMSLFESMDSSGEVSLSGLFDAPVKIDGTNNLSLERLAFLVCRGGWPKASDLDDDIALDQAYDYYDAVVHNDISRVDGIDRNPERVKSLMRSYARHQGTQASIDTICEDMKSNEGRKLSSDTVLSYINALKRIFVIEEMPAWNPNLRSKTAIRTSNTKYFVDPSIAVAALGLGPDDLLSDLNTFGLLFESMCIRDLRVFADSLNGNVYHYRDARGLECDAVIHLRNGSYGLIEIKLGGDSLIEEGAQSLRKLRDKIDTGKMKEPSFLMILVGVGNFAYRRSDGIYVVPIGCLRN